MNSKHTPGPWTAREPNGRGMGWKSGPCWLGEDSYSDETAANARLVAAAPDMLNALRSLLRHAERQNEVLAQECGIRFVDSGPLDMARDTLRRAVGDA